MRSENCWQDKDMSCGVVCYLLGKMLTLAAPGASTVDELTATSTFSGIVDL